MAAIGVNEADAQIVEQLIGYELPCGLTLTYNEIMPIITKIQLKHRKEALLRETEFDEYGFHVSVAILGKNANWGCFYWAKSSRLLLAIDKAKAEATRHGQKYKPEYRYSADNKLDALWQAVVFIAKALNEKA